MAETLPKDATIVLTFANGTGSSSTMGSSNKVDYGLEFFKTLALKRLVAKSTYTVMDVSFSPIDRIKFMYRRNSKNVSSRYIHYYLYHR